MTRMTKTAIAKTGLLLVAGVLISSPRVRAADFQWQTSCSYLDASVSYDFCGMLEFGASSSGASSYGYRQALPGSTTLPDYGHPGPTIRVEAGKRYILTLRNNAGEATNLHTHGLHVSGSGNEDDVTRAVGPGECLHYSWTIPSYVVGGTLWYHAHHHGNTKQQVSGGAYGMIIVKDNLNSKDPTTYLLSSVSDATSRANIEGFLQNEKTIFAASVGNGWYSNGGATPANVQVYQNVWTRFRIAISDAGANRNTIQFTATTRKGTNPCSQVLVLANDGVYHYPATPGPDVSSKGVSITGASRVDLAVRCPGTGTAFVMFGNQEIAQVGVVQGATPAGYRNFSPYVDGANGSQAWMPNRPAYLKDLTTGVAVPALRKYQVSMNAAAINGFQWNSIQSLDSADPNLNPVSAWDDGSDSNVYEWELRSTGAHPFHLHLYHMQVVSGCSGHEPGQYYDTISSSDTCIVRFKAHNLGGKLVLHCHVLNHEDNGAMSWIYVQNGWLPPSNDPALPVAATTCPNNSGGGSGGGGGGSCTAVAGDFCPNGDNDCCLANGLVCSSGGKPNTRRCIQVRRHFLRG